MRRLVARLPVWARTQPLDCMFALLGLPSGVLSLLGVVRSRAMEELLPWWATRLWAVCLLVGCVAWLAGASSVRERDGLVVATRLPAWMLGLHLLSLACAVYAVAIIVVGGWAGVLAAYPLVVAAAGTYIRRVDLVDRFRGQS
jgi:hypothetical protein